MYTPSDVGTAPQSSHRSSPRSTARSSRGGRSAELLQSRSQLRSPQSRPVSALAASAIERMETPCEDGDQQSASRLGSRRASKQRSAASVSERHAEKVANIIGVFKRLRDADGELHRDQLIRVLGLLGYVEPEAVWVNEVFDGLFAYSTLNQDELLTFVLAYEERQEQEGAKLFAQTDIDGSGLIDFSELRRLLYNIGITPMQHVIEGIVKEAVKGRVVGDLKNVKLSYLEFRQVAEIVRAQEGFTRAEVDEFQRIFDYFDADESGELDTRELMSTLSYLGYALEMNEVAEIAEEVDLDGSGSISLFEFLACLRKVREREILRICDIFTGTVKPSPFRRRESVKVHEGAGALLVQGVEAACEGLYISSEQLEDVLHELGYLPERVAVLEAAEDAGIIERDPSEAETEDASQSSLQSRSEGLTFEEVWRFLEVFRRRDGLTRSEVVEIDAAFERYDLDGNGILDNFEVGRMLRSMGYSVPFNVQRRLVAEVDMNASGTIDLAEFKKMVRRYHMQEAQKMQKLFQERQQKAQQTTDDGSKAEALPMPGLNKALEGLLDKAETAEMMDFSLFNSLAKEARKKARIEVRSQCGFTQTEVADLRKRFEAYNEASVMRGGVDGELSGFELRKVLKDLFPQFALSAVHRPQLIKIFEEADSDGSGSVDFEEFLCLVRECHDLRDRARLEAERKAIADCTFSRHEVVAFRDLFIGETERNEMTLNEILELLRLSLPLGERNQKVVIELYAQSVEGGVNARMHFGDFLMLIKKLVDMDFAGISSLANSGNSQEAFSAF
eukprot:TRINITY_DN33095_c0_g1_i3.p1 TRINITY_DN33095_c0_g1~~TRINITY_DN33095_c0_g1_i3.p1  ORF type:complete len:789 (-),score=238.32 TRINITY_DN33095_c0_g1_i3:371-2737(-)